MNPIERTGLRPLFNRSNSTARVELFIPAGAEIAVDDEVAAQLGAAFAPVGDTSKADGVAARELAAATADAAALEADTVPGDEPDTTPPVAVSTPAGPTGATRGGAAAPKGAKGKRGR